MNRFPRAAGPTARNRLTVRLMGAALESLERRLLFNSYVVTTTADGGAGSLRQAILDANALPGGDLVSFAIPGGGVHTIAPATPLPELTDPVTIDGATQPGYHGMPLIELDGAAAGLDADGLTLDTGQTIIAGLAINRFSADGLLLQSGSFDILRANFIGTDPAGTMAEGNGGSGIVVRGPSATIGGASPADRNVISGNRMSGVVLAAAGPRVWNNYIGTNSAGDTPLGNHGEGIDVNGTGNTSPISLGVTILNNSMPIGAGNLISGNGSSGILVASSASQVTIAGNRIGTDAAGTAAVPNGSSADAPYHDGITSLDPNLLVGGNMQQTRNLISGNRGAGIHLDAPSDGETRITGNYIGPNAAGNAALGNQGDGILAASAVFRLGDLDAPHGNLISGNGHDGILVTGNPTFDFIDILHNLIGTDATGASAIGNGGNGIELVEAARVTIGEVGGFNGSNVISGNAGDGILVRATSQPTRFDNAIRGNFIGTDRTGMLRLGNGRNGIELLTSGTVVGGEGTFNSRSYVPSNIISANAGSGIRIGRGDLPLASNNTIQGNYIGLDAAGDYKPDLGNDGDGITLVNAAHTLVGDFQTFTRRGNAIAWNGGNGITVSGGATAVDNQFTSNTIYFNDKLGIDLNEDGVTPNDPGDADTGPNQLQNFPVITSVLQGTRRAVVTYTLNAMPNTTYRVDFFASVRHDPSGFGEGQQFVGNDTVQTGRDGTVTRTKIFTSQTNFAGIFTATATDPAGNTSEFSAAVSAQPLPPLTVTAAAYDPSGNLPAIRVTFSNDVTVDPASLQIINLTPPAPPKARSIQYDPTTHTATYRPGAFPDGHFRATIVSDDVRDIWGQNLNDGKDYVFDFYVAAGDLNLDGMVNFEDLLALSRSYRQAGGFTQGDLDHNGKVDFADLLLLVQHYGNSVR